MRSAALLGLALAACGCTRVFFQPTRTLYPALERARPPAEAVAFVSEDGTQLRGFFFPAVGVPARGTVVHAHGNAQNASAHFPFAHWLTAEGFNVLAFDYRGYGGSRGLPSLRGAARDVRAAVRYAGSRPDTDPDRVVLFGQSLGGALAVAALAGAQRPRVRAVAVESAFASYADVAQDKLAGFFLTWPLQWPLSRLLFSTRFDAGELAKRLAGTPLLVIHGDRDRIVPYAEGVRLFQAAREPKEFWTVKGGGHTEAFTRYGAAYRPRLAGFFARALEQRQK